MTARKTERKHGATRRGWILALWVSCAPGAAQAVEQTTVTVTVTIITPTCEVNGNNLIEVDFGSDVLTTRIDGSYKKTPVPYSVECKNAPSTAMKLWIEGTGAAFDGKVLRTNQTDFGIAFLNAGIALPINSWLKFTYPKLPTLEAVPVKRNGAKLTGGAFSSGATMKVEYQ
ncbi:fimbrial protein [Serratia proteamaculans]|uniref:fimbrial protein n=1 Tax=Serratia proteamaculans TaxID=28151 RepID=UPI003CE79EF9